MAEDRVTIDWATLFDNIGDRQVDFSGEASGERYDFAVQYDVLEALGAQIPNGDAVADRPATSRRTGARRGKGACAFWRDRTDGRERERPDQAWPAGRPHSTG